VTILDGRATVATELSRSQDSVKTILKNEFKAFLKNQDFLASLDAHISDRLNLKGRREIILERLKIFTES
jgi:hypothetical protein